MILEQHIIKKFGNRVRTRVCGILANEDGVLLVRHEGLGEEGDFWSFPGGEINFGTPVKQNVAREVREETGLLVKVGKFIGVTEFFKPPLHAVELFFKITREGGDLATGYDPELPPSRQIIKEARFVTFRELSIIPQTRKHQLLHHVNKEADLYNPQVFFVGD